MKYTDGKNIMVYAQSADGAPVGAALETVSKAAELAKANGEEVIAVVFGKDTDTKTVITAGASKVLVAGEEGLPAEEKAQILVKLAEKYQPKAVYMAGTPEGKMIAPAVSAVFESGCVTDVTGITADGVYTSLSYNGNVLNDMKMGENLPHVATVRSGSFAKKLDESRTGEVIAEDASADTVRTKVVETVKEIAETVNLEEAQIIVSGGRGMGSKENFALVEELAEVMGGVVGATRPAIEEGWVSRAHQVGQSGKIVAPKLYIACGISGATQHVSGMIGSGYIVAINKDEDASIFDVADAGIVGDVTKILPVMIEEMKKRFGDAVYTTEENVTLEESVIRLLEEKKMTVTTAESCTGGKLSGRLLNVSGASGVYNEGYITYANASKEKILGVKHETLETYGAVSEQTAAEMALGAAKAAGADAALSVTGIAGPGGGTAEKPVGLVYIGCAVNGEVTVREYRFTGNREKNRDYAVARAITLLREELLKRA